MENVDIKVDGKTLVIRVDLSQDQGLSGSGKSRIVASTCGNVPVGDGVMVGLNVYRPTKR